MLRRWVVSMLVTFALSLALIGFILWPLMPPRLLPPVRRGRKGVAGALGDF